MDNERIRLSAVEVDIFIDVACEVRRAKEKHPRSRFNLLAFVEEVGELAQAVRHRLDDEEPNPRAREWVRKQAIQVMAILMRLLIEGDNSLKLGAFNELRGVDHGAGRQCWSPEKECSAHRR